MMYHLGMIFYPCAIYGLYLYNQILLVDFLEYIATLFAKWVLFNSTLKVFMCSVEPG